MEELDAEHELRERLRTPGDYSGKLNDGLDSDWLTKEYRSTYSRQLELESEDIEAEA